MINLIVLCFGVVISGVVILILIGSVLNLIIVSVFEVWYNKVVEVGFFDL